MDCRTALDMLECDTLEAPPSAAGGADPELSAARAHVRDCPRCAAAFRALQERDRQIAQAMQDIPVPAGLRERLFAALALESPGAGDTADAVAAEIVPGEGATIPAAEAPPAPVAARRRRNRSWGTAAAAAVVAAVVVGGWWAAHSGTSRVPLAEWRNEAGTAWDEFALLPEFDGGFDAIPPASWPAAIQFTPPRGVPHPDVPGHAAALYAFRLGSGGAVVEGVVLAVPASAIDSPPENTYFNVRSAAYAAAGGSATVAWTEGDLVYVCSVRGGREPLERLQRALDFPAV
ncbi:MAG: hypothetical protein WED34_20320 [Planctomycetales bacterium]